MDSNFALIWDHIAAAIRPEVSPDTFQRWFHAIQLVEANEMELSLRVPNNIYQLWIESNYQPLMQAAVLSVLGAPRKINFVVSQPTPTSPLPAVRAEPAEPAVPAGPADSPRHAEPVESGAFPDAVWGDSCNATAAKISHRPSRAAAGAAARRPASESTQASALPETPELLSRSASPGGASTQETFAQLTPELGKHGAASGFHTAHGHASGTAPAGPKMPDGLNPRNTFESFVVGANNQFAHAAALAVSQNPAKTYNPYFLYGGVGLGKTHLMHAIGQQVAAHKKGVRVLYISSEKFTNEFIDAIQNSKLVKFRQRYRQADILLIDDIQFLAGKERSQEEFFHTFNTLFDGHKQIILSSDRPPSEIQNLEQRLVSRFEWGLTAELQPPDVETRVAILRKKAGSLHIKLDNAVLEFLAQRIRTNVRRLEGALMRVASFASLSGKELTPEAVEHLLKDILQEEARRAVTIEQIQRKVAEHYDIRLADMTSKRRPANIAFPRQVAMYLARELTKTSLSEIGDSFGGRDHGTVLHAHRLVKEKMLGDDKVRQIVAFLDTQLNR